MHDAMDLKLDKSDNDWFTDQEKDVFLNFAIIQYVQEKHDLFEINEKVNTALHNLVRTLAFPGVSQFDLATVQDYLYTLALEANWENDCYPGGIMKRPIRKVQLDDYAEMSRDPFNKPIDDDPIYLQESSTNGNQIVFKILSDTVPTTVVMKYLKMPTAVSLPNGVDCELHPSVHEEIVDIAVRKAMVPIQDEMYPVQVQEQKQDS